MERNELFITLIEKAINKMKCTKVFYPEGFYLFESKASANSNYIENLEEARLLLTYMDYYLKDYLDIQEYFISRHGFQIAVKLKSESKIVEAYNRQGAASTSGRPEIWRIVSNRVRLFLSTYVRRINYRRGRKGVLVRASYKKYFFEKLDEALEHLEKMRNREVNLKQRRKRYRGLKKHYRIGSKFGKGSIYLSSKEVKLGRKKWDNYELKWGLPSLVVQNWVINTKTLQFTSDHHQKHHSNTKKPPDI